MYRFLLIMLFLIIPSLGVCEDIFTASIDPDGVQRVQIVGSEYQFKPGHIIVKVDIPVELKLMKESWIIPHSFVLKVPDSDIDIDESLSNEPRIVRFTPRKTGRYPFYCNKKLLFFKSHREKGMEGTIEVTE